MRNKQRLGRRLPMMALASAGLILPSPLAAQSLATPPLAPTRDELTRAQPSDAPPRPTLNIVGGIERSPCPLADPRYADELLDRLR